MSTIQYKCPCCGAALFYSGDSGKLTCTACGEAFDVEAMEAMEPFQEEQSIEFSVAAQPFTAADDSQMDAYHCQNCGAELICEATTTATCCPYCGSPTILPDHIQGGVKPEKVVPFLVTKEQAAKMFQDYFTGKRLLPNIFKTGNEICEMRKLYVPYWLYDCVSLGDVVYDAKKVETKRQGEWEITTTKHYVVRRAGSMEFENIPVDGSTKLDNKITESLEPYDFTKAVPFQSAVLSGAMADHADEGMEECRQRAAERVAATTESALRNTVTGYQTVTVRRKNISSQDGKATPVLMPVWLITTNKNMEGQQKTYTFAINGQSGQLTCDVPYAKGKAWGWFFGIFLGVLAAGCGIFALLGSLGSGTALIAGIAGLLAALITVGGMKGKLKTAMKKSNAANYVRSGSFKLDRKLDYLLYQETQKKKIENQPQSK